ncbi:SMI1/KNR4 family protein [Pseudanabaena sp. UWO310]|uniref:SMI1/KNR4 family protein n=1 Tax=Pseudanabaena sp. UWO310 TaxID=2480795 RepID=UPI001157EB5E|nr:SMI1/KNR4 family protein [Pseudanabaena sp. UWO310]TYQ31140.1 SMI1/KNR4 family protein [Pseudanabaena sp. UWO310]
MSQLTPEQEQQIPSYAKKWRDIAYSTEPIDREKVTEIISRAYFLLDKKAPPIIFCGSPFDYLQKISVFANNSQPLDFSRIADRLNLHFGKIFQELGDFHKQATDLAKESSELNPKMQMSVDEVLQESFPEVFNLDELESNVEQWQKERKEASQQFQQELKESFPEFELPEEFGEGLNTALDYHNKVQSEILRQITHEQRSYISELLGNRSTFKPRILYNLIDKAIRPYSENLAPRLVYNAISNISCADNYNWFDFSISVLGCDCDLEWWQSSVDIMQNCGYVYPFENICYVCDRPSKILFDENGLAHALGEPAIEYRDGFKIFVCHGTLFTEKYISVPISQWQPQWYIEEKESRLREALIEVLPSDQLQVEWLLAEENTNLRQLLTNKIGHERILNDIKINDDLNILSQSLQDNSASSFWVAYAILKNQLEPKIQKVIEKWKISRGTFRELLQMLLIDSLERILAWQNQNVPDYEDDFQQGLTYEEIEEKVKDLPFKLPREFYHLYQWRNGSSRESGIFLYLYHCPIEQALEYNEYINYPESIGMRIEDNCSPYLFPLFDFDGEYFAIQGIANEVETSFVCHIGADGGGEKLIFNSLTTMMMAIAESYESGVYIYEPEYNSVSWEDMEKSGQIRLKYNIGTAKRIYGEGG